MLKKVATIQDVSVVASIAKLIWREHYIPIIGEHQVNYMLDTFQSEKAINQHIKEDNYEYYLLQEQTKPVGYLAVQYRKNELFLSKLYVDSNYRGRGLAKSGISLAIKLAKQNDLKVLALTVNKNNLNSIAAYYKLGFIKTGECCVDIGHSYVMDDITMALQL